MNGLIDINILKQAAADVRAHFPDANPTAAFVLGSGWSDAIKVFHVKKEVSYADITGFGKSHVVGHAGKLALAEIDGKEFLVWQGRKHFYEGLGWTAVALPAFISKSMGCSKFFASNAAGGTTYKPGDLMIIRDHINNMGCNVLQGPHYPELGARFPDMTYAYDPELRAVLKSAAAAVGITVVEGVYLANSGPTYETPAEVKLANTIGADAVGMSTVPEVIIANAMGMKVAAISCITNYAAGMTGQPLTHTEVVETLDAAMGNIHKLLPEIIRRFA